MMGGRGARSLFASRMVKYKQLRKNLTSAKAQETKAYTKLVEAKGALHMTPSDRPDLKKQRTKEANKAYRKYTKAQNKRIGIENKIDKFANKMRGGN